MRVDVKVNNASVFSYYFLKYFVKIEGVVFVPASYPEFCNFHHAWWIVSLPLMYIINWAFFFFFFFFLFPFFLGIRIKMISHKNMKLWFITYLVIVFMCRSWDCIWFYEGSFLHGLQRRWFGCAHIRFSVDFYLTPIICFWTPTSAGRTHLQILNFYKFLWVNKL